MTLVHVAVVGLVRSFSFCLPSIIKNVIDPLQQVAETTTSFHLSRTRQELSNPRTEEYLRPGYDVEHLVEDFPVVFHELEDLRIEGQEVFLQLLNYDREAKRHRRSKRAVSERALTIRNYVESLTLLKRSIDDVRAFPASVYLVVRPDIIYLEPFLFKNLLDIASQSILTPSWGSRAGANDRYASVSKQFVPTYFSRIDSLPEYVRRTEKFQPKGHLEWELRNSPHHKILPFETARVRADMSISLTDRRRVSLSRPDLVHLLDFVWGESQ